MTSQDYDDDVFENESLIDTNNSMYRVIHDRMKITVEPTLKGLKTLDERTKELCEKIVNFETNYILKSMSDANLFMLRNQIVKELNERGFENDNEKNKI